MTKIFKKIKSKKRGFTLIELIVVIAILAVLAAILVPSMLGFIGDAKQQVADTNARLGYTAAQAYVTKTAAQISTSFPAINGDWKTALSNYTGTVSGAYYVKLTTSGSVVYVLYSDPNGKTGCYPANVASSAKSEAVVSTVGASQAVTTP